MSVVRSKIWAFSHLGRCHISGSEDSVRNWFRCCSVNIWLFATPWLQHTRLPCPSLSPGIWINLCPLSRWCYPTISSSVAPFSSCPRFFPASESFPMSQLFTSGGPSTGASASALVLPINIQGCFPLGWTGLISLCPRDSQESSPAPQFESINSLALSLLYAPTLTSIHDYWKNHSFYYMDICWQRNVSAF